MDSQFVEHYGINFRQIIEQSNEDILGTKN